MTNRLFQLGAALLCASAISAMAFAADVHVDQNNEGTQDGSTLRPYRTITAAVAAANSNDAVLVARGTYMGPVRVEGKTLTIRGGYFGGSASTYMGGTPGDFSASNPAANNTTIEGVAMNAVVLLIESGASILEGFSIRGGGGAREDAFRTQGGGVYVDGGAPTICNNIIEDNHCENPEQETFGGGIYTRSADTTIINNIIRSNRVGTNDQTGWGRGAGITCSGGNVQILDNDIEGNIAEGDHGGALYIFSPNALIQGNRITGNEVGRNLGYGWGGGIIIFNPGAFATIRFNEISNNFSGGRGSGIFIDDGADALVEHCLIYGNETNPDSGAGAVYVDIGQDNKPSTVTLRHCTVYGNLTPEPTLGGNGLFVEQFCSAIVENCIFWGNDGYSIFGDVAVTYSTTEEAHPGTGNLTGDPLFANAAAGDFHVRSRNGRWNPAASAWVLDAVDSPCIDAANPASPFDLEPAGNGGRANQGRYGNTAQASRTVNPDNPTGSGYIVR